ncbi:hypothetical protein BH23GEM6_BH23GEM6_23920 [soil metagenome]
MVPGRGFQLAVERRPELLLGGLRPALALSAEADITWHSPRAADDFAEYPDMEVLRRLRIESIPEVPLGEFWQRRGPVWDAFGKGAIHFAPERGFGYAPCLN